MDRKNIRLLALEYLSLVTSGRGDDVEDKLALLLDRLALAVNGMRFEFDSRDYADPKRTEYQVWYSRAGSTFPGLGYYNSVSPVAKAVGEAALGVGDAIDDIADIAIALEEAVNRWDESVDDALWHLDLDYRGHWCEHLRNLQLYLHMRRIDG